MPIIRSWALTRGFALHPGIRNRYEIRDTRTQHRPPSRQVNDHGRVSENQAAHTPATSCAADQVPVRQQRTEGASFVRHGFCDVYVSAAPPPEGALHVAADRVSQPVISSHTRSDKRQPRCLCVAAGLGATAGTGASGCDSDCGTDGDGSGGVSDGNGCSSAACGTGCETSVVGGCSSGSGVGSVVGSCAPANLRGETRHPQRAGDYPGIARQEHKGADAASIEGR